jgi:hypothetical protein
MNSWAFIIDIEKYLSKEFAFLSAKIAPVRKGNRLFRVSSLMVFTGVYRVCIKQLLIFGVDLTLKVAKLTVS